MVASNVTVRSILASCSPSAPSSMKSSAGSAWMISNGAEIDFNGVENDSLHCRMSQDRGGLSEGAQTKQKLPEPYQGFAFVLEREEM